MCIIKHNRRCIVGTDMVRLNITFPTELAQQLNLVVRPGKRSQFIADAVRENIAQLQKEKTDKLLEEGYKVSRQESLSITREFETIDLEGWDEY